MSTKDIRIDDYDYPLPDARIAKFPVAQRDHSKLLLYRAGTVSEDHFYNLPQHLPVGALMVFNNTKVIQARLHFRKETGALIEVFLLEPAAPADYELMFQATGACEWHCLVGNAKKWKDGSLRREITVAERKITLQAERVGEETACHRVRLTWDDSTISFSEIVEAAGELPIPPYLNRATVDADNTTYQTVYSKIKGSVAAPTAGLHFTPDVLAHIDARGIEREELTLHVGAGTFRPVKSDDIGHHEMHTEYISVRRHTIDRLLAHHAEAIAVGTTTVRTLESLYYMGRKLLREPNLTEEQLHVGQWEPYEASTEAEPTPCEALQAIADFLTRHHQDTLRTSTQIIIAPGYKYHIVRRLITNFHQPKSTLLLLVSAFVGGDWHKIYDYALAHDFRFLSYGDSSLLVPEAEVALS